MATWREIGTDSFRAGQEALTGRRYRSSVSRSYYAAFSLLTCELARTGVVFRHGRQTPSHAEMADLVTTHLLLLRTSHSSRKCVAARLPFLPCGYIASGWMRITPFSA